MIQKLLGVYTLNFQNKAFYFQRWTENAQTFNISRLQLSPIQRNTLHVQHLYIAYLTLQNKWIPGKVSINAFLSLILEVSENPLCDPVMNSLESR